MRKKPKTRKAAERADVRHVIESARSATDETAPSAEEILALLHACEDLMTRFSGYERLLRDVLLRGDDSPPSRALAHAVTSRHLRECTRVVEGVIGRKAERVYVVEIVERVAQLRTAESVFETPSVMLARCTALAQPYAYVRQRIRLVLPELALRASDEVLGPALAACESAGPGKRGSNKWKALSDMWRAMTGERIDPDSMRVDQANARDSR